MIKFIISYSLLNSLKRSIRENDEEMNSLILLYIWLYIDMFKNDEAYTLLLSLFTEGGKIDRNFPAYYEMMFVELSKISSDLRLNMVGFLRNNQNMRHNFGIIHPIQSIENEMYKNIEMSAIAWDFIRITLYCLLHQTNLESLKSVWDLLYKKSTRIDDAIIFRKNIMEVLEMDNNQKSDIAFSSSIVSTCAIKPKFLEFI